SAAIFALAARDDGTRERFRKRRHPGLKIRLAGQHSQRNGAHDRQGENAIETAEIDSMIPLAGNDVAIPAIINKPGIEKHPDIARNNTLARRRDKKYALQMFSLPLPALVQDLGPSNETIFVRAFLALAPGHVCRQGRATAIKMVSHSPWLEGFAGNK